MDAIDFINQFDNEHFKYTSSIKVSDLTVDEKNILLGINSAGINSKQFVVGMLTSLKEALEMYYIINKKSNDFSNNHYINFSSLSNARITNHMLNLRIGVNNLSHIIGINLRDLLLPGSKEKHPENNHCLCDVLKKYGYAVFAKNYPKAAKVEGNFREKIRSLNLGEEELKTMGNETMLTAAIIGLKNILNDDTTLNKLVSSFRNALNDDESYIPNIFRIIRKSSSLSCILKILNGDISASYTLYRNSDKSPNNEKQLYLLSVDQPIVSSLCPSLEFGVDSEGNYFVRSNMLIDPIVKGLIGTRDRAAIGSLNVGREIQFMDFKNKEISKFFVTDNVDERICGSLGSEHNSNLFDDFKDFIMKYINKSQSDFNQSVCDEIDSRIGNLLYYFRDKEDRNVICRYIGLVNETLVDRGIDLSKINSKFKYITNIEDLDRIYELEICEKEVMERINIIKIDNIYIELNKVRNNILSKYYELSEDEKELLGSKLNNFIKILNIPISSDKTTSGINFVDNIDSFLVSCEDLGESCLEVATELSYFDSYEEEILKLFGFANKQSDAVLETKAHEIANNNLMISLENKTLAKVASIYLEYKKLEILCKKFKNIIKYKSSIKSPYDFIEQSKSLAAESSLSLKKEYNDSYFDIFNELTSSEVKKLYYKTIANDLNHLEDEYISLLKMNDVISQQMKDENVIIVQSQSRII